MRFLCITALLLATTGPALAEPSVEVMHFWISGGEADAPVAGGGGDAAKTALQARIASGNPPAAMLMLGQNILDWANEGLLGNVDDLAAAKGWDAALPQAVKGFTKVDGQYVSVPTNVRRTDMIWGQEVLASAIMDPAVQVAFSQAKGAIPARTDIDLSALDARAQSTSAALSASVAGGTAVPTFASTHAADAAIVGAATDAITAFFNSDMSAVEGAETLGRRHRCGPVNT